MLSSCKTRECTTVHTWHDGSVVVIQGFPAAKILIKHSTVVRPLHSEWPTVWSKASQPASQPGSCHNQRDVGRGVFGLLWWP